MTFWTWLDRNPQVAFVALLVLLGIAKLYADFLGEALAK